MRPPLHVVVRAARPEDAMAIHRVQERSIRELGPTAYTPAEVESWAKGLRAEAYVKAMVSGSETMLVAEANGRILGFGSLKPLEISAIYVDPDVARRGVGGAVLRRLEDLAQAQGRRSVRLTASLPGEPFYRAHGYREIGRRKHPTRGGIPIDAVVMEKDLSLYGR